MLLIKKGMTDRINGLIKRDVAYTLAKCGLATIPIIGSLVAEIL
jgi:hypothetical protein